MCSAMPVSPHYIRWNPINLEWNCRDWELVCWPANDAECRHESPLAYLFLVIENTLLHHFLWYSCGAPNMRLPVSGCAPDQPSSGRFELVGKLKLFVEMPI